MANFFPRWTNWIPLKLVICGIIAVCGLSAATWYYATPKYTKIGYEPIQPVPFPHDIHVSQLGMDCRYCHSFVEMAAQSNVPNTQTCMNCHTQVQKDNPKLEPVRTSWQTGNRRAWRGASNAIGTPKIFCGPTIRFSISIGNRTM